MATDFTPERKCNLIMSPRDYIDYDRMQQAVKSRVSVQETNLSLVDIPLILQWGSSNSRDFCAGGERSLGPGHFSQNEMRLSEVNSLQNMQFATSCHGNITKF